MTHVDFKDQKPELLVSAKSKEWHRSFVKKIQLWKFQVDTTPGSKIYSCKFHLKTRSLNSDASKVWALSAYAETILGSHFNFWITKNYFDLDIKKNISPDFFWNHIHDIWETFDVQTSFLHIKITCILRTRNVRKVVLEKFCKLYTSEIHLF